MQKHSTLEWRIYLCYLRHIFDPRYGRELSDEEFEDISYNLIAFGEVIKEFYRKKEKIHGKKFNKWVKENIIDQEVKDK